MLGGLHARRHCSCWLVPRRKPYTAHAPDQANHNPPALSVAASRSCTPPTTRTIRLAPHWPLCPVFVVCMRGAAPVLTAPSPPPRYHSTKSESPSAAAPTAWRRCPRRCTAPGRCSRASGCPRSSASSQVRARCGTSPHLQLTPASCAAPWGASSLPKVIAPTKPRPPPLRLHRRRDVLPVPLQRRPCPLHEPGGPRVVRHGPHQHRVPGRYDLSPPRPCLPRPHALVRASCNAPTNAGTREPLWLPCF